MNTDTVMNNTNETTPSVAVKVTRGDEMRRFNFKGQSFQEIKNIIAEIFSIPAADFTLQYEDDEKDRVTISSDAELKEAIQLHKYVLRFFVLTTKPSTGDTNTHVPAFPHPFPPHYHHHRHHHEHPHGVAPHVTEGDVNTPPPPFGPHGQGRHGHPHAPGPFGRPFGPFGGHGPYRHPGHGAHGHKRRLDKEEKEAMKCEKKRWKKQRKSESSSEEEAQKKEMKQLMKATKESIKANWAPIKADNPAQWPQNRELMVAEIKLAKRIIREQGKNKSTNTPIAAASPTAAAAAAVTEQNTPIVPVGAEMQA